ncbi:MAG: inorganic phosphate transporter [Clostridiales Family XIII bacterium]|jgi:PiT family inorganic phosphate transporter|nr:inorganic phosphate transporter [Clostridiales Family XIII bacterium]
MTILIFAIVIVALIFEFINGFHDTANAIATSVYTKVLSVGKAILLAAGMNFIGALISGGVAETVTHGLVNFNPETYVILAALIGAIIWNLLTWWKGIPSSSSHALLGSLAGAVIVYTRSLDDVIWSGYLYKVVLPLFISPTIGFFLGLLLMKVLVLICKGISRGKTNSVFAKLQILSAAALAFSHGTNDAQKTMGIITLALINGGFLSSDASVPFWVKITCAATIAIGTSVGGWKIMKTMGGGVTKLDPSSGFVAETSSSIVIILMTVLGAPISTTHVITSSVMGVGSAKRLSAVKWSKAKEIVLTWVITIPISAALGGIMVYILGFIV